MTPADIPTSDVRDSAVGGCVPANDAADQPLSSAEKEDLAAFAYVEYFRLVEQGQSPDLQEWCTRFPECRTNLRGLFAADNGIARLVDALANGSGNDAIAWPLPGGQCEGFTIVRELARGGWARVYLATEASTGDRLVVLKCSLHGDAEARTMGRLSHPNIVPILSARLEKRSALTMVCMPYLGSATLQDVLDRLRMPPPVAGASGLSSASFLLDVIRSRTQPEDPPPPLADPRLRKCSYADGVIHLAAQLAETLAFLHEHGVYHRDLKPSNVLLDPSGKPLLLDFNVSQSAREAVVPIGGTLRYMAPEQLRAYLDACKDGMDERADTYALGVMVYELLGGEHPCVHSETDAFGPESAKSMLVELQRGFRPFRVLCPQLERPVAAILDRCVALDAADRPRSAAALAVALKRQFTPARRMRRCFAAHPRSLLGTLCLLMAVVAALGYAWAVTPPYSQREYERGRIAYRAGDFDAAETHFDRALRAEPNNPRFRQARGCARLQQSKYLPKDKAKLDAVHDDLISTEQGAADARTLAVNAYIKTRKQYYREAIEMYKHPALSGYRPVMVLNNRAYTYLSVGRFKEAQDDLDQAVRLDPNCQTVRYNRAMIALRMQWRGKMSAIPRQSLDDMEKAIQLGSATCFLYRDAASLYARSACDNRCQQRLERALFYLRQALVLGAVPPDFEGYPVLEKALTSAEFVGLIVSPPAQVADQSALRLIDPVDLPD